MRIRLLWVGKTRERSMADGINLYLRKLKPFADIDVVEIKEEKGKPDVIALEREGERILKQAASDFVLLDERGRESDSLEFAASLRDRSSAEFVLGGAFGVSGDVKKAAGKRKLALSKMTFTHEMARLFFLEQIYRAMMINAGRDYHH